MIARRSRNGEWRTGKDFRVICTCQVHAARQGSPWRRAARVAVRTVAALATLPIAFMAFDLPINAMNLKLDTAVQKIDALRSRGMRAASRPSAPRPRSVAPSTAARPATPARNARQELRIFTTDAIREQFAPMPHVFTFDAVKEEYFRTKVPYGAIIYREARKNNLPPELVAAMVHTESDFRPGLVSHKSAQGLMQIVPDTARLLGIANVFDPEQNIAAGTKYFRYLLDRFDDERVALAAYNAGEGKVERCGCIPAISETQSYIEKVNVRAHRYRQRVRNTYIAARRIKGPDFH